MENVPPEIYTAIFQLLNEAEWIQCANVCQSWRAIVPFAVANLWQHVDIDCKTIACLSALRHFPSVQSVKLDSVSPFPILPAGQITKLEVLHEQVYTTTNWVLGLQDHFPYLTSFVFVHCKLDTLDLTIILNACPNLTHFSLRIHFYLEDTRESGERLPLPPIKNALRLASLELSTGNANLTIKPILARCPDLLSLKLDPRCLHPRPTCQEIFELCPKLSHLVMGDYFESIFEQHGWPHVIGADTFKDNGLLRCLRLDHEYILDAMVPQLLQTVEVLQVRTLMYQGTFMGSEHLKVFVCDHVMEARDLAHLFRHSPNLEKIIIKNTADDFIFLHPNVLEAAKSLTRLTSIRLPLWIDFAIASRFIKLFESQLLELSLCGIKDTSSFDILKGFTALARLGLFDRSHGQTISLAALKHLPALKYIKLLYFEDLDHESMLILQNLVSIELMECGKAACERLVACVNKARRLQQVKITYNWAPHGMESLVASCQKRNIKLILEEIW